MDKHMPACDEVFPNVFRVTIPLPNNALKELNSYFILSDEKTTIVDVGFNHPECTRALDLALHHLGRSWDSVEVVLTHSHPDHTGALDSVWKRGMNVYAHMHSFQEVNYLMNMESAVFNPLLRGIVNATPETIGSSTRNANRFKVSSQFFPLKKDYELLYLEEGDTYRCGDYSFRVIATPGHDDWHIVLFEEQHKFLIAGDAILETITPNISSWLTPYNALDEFLHSLDKIAALDVEIALPGHGTPFTGVKERAEFLKQHHENRLEEIYRLVEDGHSDAVDIARNCKWKHPEWDEWSLNSKFFSLSETMAHLVYLVNDCRIQEITCGTTHTFKIA